MGEVYLAQDTKLDRKAALKILSAELAGNQDRMRRFTQEAKTASALNHPNILTIYEIDETSSGHFIATEFIEGMTLREQMRNAPMKLIEILEVATQIASALAAAHEANIIHRDIKPENIMLRRDGIVKVLDFGLAKLAEPTAGQANVDSEAPTRAAIKTGPGVVLGTPQYMSPEQARGLDLDARSDIWSLGVVLYEMVAGRPPFFGETKSHTVVSILETEPPPLTTFTRETSTELQRIVRKAIAKDRDNRYQTARDLMIDLKNLRRDLDLQSELERSSTPSRQQNVSSNPEIETQLHAAPVTARAETLQPRQLETATTSSSGFFISHTRAVTIGVVLFLLAVIVVGYWFWDRRAASVQSIDSIAVLPFINQNSDADSEYLSDGLTESIINSLAQLPNLKVIARSSVFRYKGNNKDPLTIGKELGVRAVLTGRIMQRGDNMVISAELLDVHNNRQLWGEQYSKKVSDLLLVQRDIAKEITGNLRLTLSGEEQSRVAKHYTDNVEAYRLYLQGRFYWNKRTEESYKRAIDYFRQAIEKDPNYALAYTGLADSYSFLSSQGIRPPQDVFPLAKDAATKALQIDPALSEAHTSLAYVKLYYDWDWTEAEQEYKKAIELNPNYATPHHGYAYLLISSGRTEEAFSEIKKAEAIDPLSVLFQADHGEYFYFVRRPDEAIAQLQKAIDMDPSFVRAHFLMGRALIQKGRCDQGIDEAVKVQNMVQAHEALGWLAQEYAACGRKAEAEKAMNELMEISRVHYVSPHWFSAVQASLGNKDEAFKWLDQALDGRFGPMIYLKVNPIWDPLRSDPRFARALQRVGLAQ